MSKFFEAYKRGRIYAVLEENISLFEFDLLENRLMYKDDFDRWTKQQTELELDYENMGVIEKIIFDLSHDFTAARIISCLERTEDPPNLPFQENKYG